ncbi:4-hydroxy-tetrahydrodipicolinate synthase [Chitinispirillales bacterium ANBcel5]|uniref:4-hydroxy-tetrahydrodipicolinate synthase n=1 Tax=Cellulosispirillum alkaliphilum TaxID=3039283 RepID=UPI002A53B8E0|nr:4-hydroxy-tetrahydrodipicolinate synthase [Chitinispirillales bacterium ANBcel5]
MKLQGCYVAIITPFTADGKIDEEGLRSNIEFIIKKGAAGIVPCGTTGESATLNWEEHNRVVKIAVEQAKGRVQVIAGAGSNNTQEAVSAAKDAAENGADAILSITPYYNKPTQEGLYQHFSAVSNNSKLPIVVYNVPGRTGINLLPETLERLCDFENIVAVKEASNDVAQVSQIHRRCGDRLTILSGDDGLTLPILSVGGKGVISVIGNIVPDKMSAMIENYLKGEHESALKIHEELLPLTKIVFIESNPVPIKEAMSYYGLHGGTVRLPLVSMLESNKEQLLNVLKSYSVSVS